MWTEVSTTHAIILQILQVLVEQYRAYSIIDLLDLPMRVYVG